MGAVALWSESRTFNGESPGSNPLAAVSKLWQYIHTKIYIFYIYIYIYIYNNKNVPLPSGGKLAW